MQNKKLFILIPILLALVIFILFFFCFKYLENDSNVNKNKNSNQAEEGNNNLDNEFDVNRILEVQQVDESRESIINNPRFSIPKDVSGVEMMTQAEKESLGIDPNLEAQVLGRSEDGRPTGYQFIYSEEDFILDVK